MNGLTLFNNRTTDIFDRFFGYDDFWTTPTVKQVSDQHRPSVNEQEDKYQIYLTAPGLEKSDFNITVEGNLLTISYDASNKKKAMHSQLNIQKHIQSQMIVILMPSQLHTRAES